MRRALLALLCLLPRAASANTGAEFLRLGAGARALGLGEAYGPLAAGAEAVYWNPAGLASGTRKEAAYARSELFGLVHHDYLGYAHPLGDGLGDEIGAVGAAFSRLSQQPIDAVDNANLSVGSFSPHSEAASVAYGRGFLKGRLSAGLALKGVRETILDETASAFAFDGGVLWRPRGSLQPRASFAFRNLGGREKFAREADDLPLEFCLGGALTYGPLTPVVEAAVPARGAAFAKLGLEFAAPVGDETRAALRLGYKTQTVAELGAVSGLTAGVGAEVGRWRFDFGFQPMGVLGESYRLALAYAW